VVLYSVFLRLHLRGAQKPTEEVAQQIAAKEISQKPILAKEAVEDTLIATEHAAQKTAEDTAEQIAQEIIQTAAAEDAS
jgi:hypothetical protein